MGFNPKRKRWKGRGEEEKKKEEKEEGEEGEWGRRKRRERRGREEDERGAGKTNGPDISLPRSLSRPETTHTRGV